MQPFPASDMSVFLFPPTYPPGYIFIVTFANKSHFSPQLLCYVFLQHAYIQPTAVMQCLYNRTPSSSVRATDGTGNFVWASLKPG